MAVLVACGCQKKAPEVPGDAGGTSVKTAEVVVVDAGAPVEAVDAGSPAAAPRWFVKDNKVRCIQAPCMSLDAMPVGSSDPTEKISDVDFSALGLSAEQQQALMAQVYGKRGLEVEGEIAEEPSKTGRGGMARVLRVSRVVSQP